MKRTQFDTAAFKEEGENKEGRFMVETIGNVSGWALAVWKAMSKQGEDAILWSVGDTDVTTSPAILMKWPMDTWIQIMWTTIQLKEFVQLKDVR